METKKRIRPSVLDRLLKPGIDLVATNSRSAAASPSLYANADETLIRQADLQALQESVRRDLEALLNTRVPITAISADFREAKTSILAYGVKDLE